MHGLQMDPQSQKYYTLESSSTYRHKDGTILTVV